MKSDEDSAGHGQDDEDDEDKIDIPECFQNSSLFRATPNNLNLHCKLFRKELINDNFNVTNMKEFTSVMLRIDYWGVDYNSWPYSIYEFIPSHINEVKTWRDDKRQCKMGVAEHVDFSNEIFPINVAPDNGAHFMAKVISNGSLNWLIYGFQQNYAYDEYTCEAAARHGFLECLQYAHENGCLWNADTCRAAAEGGHLSCLEYAHANGCPWGEWTCVAAAKGGHLSCLEYAHAHENGCLWNADTCRAAAEGGHLSCLEYAHANGCPRG